MTVKRGRRSVLLLVPLAVLLAAGGVTWWALTRPSGATAGEVVIPGKSVSLFLIEPTKEKRSGLYATWHSLEVSYAPTWVRFSGLADNPQGRFVVNDFGQLLLIGKLPGTVGKFDFLQASDGTIANGEIRISVKYVRHTGFTYPDGTPTLAKLKDMHRQVYLMVALPEIPTGKHRAEIAFENCTYTKDKGKLKRDETRKSFKPLICKFEVLPPGTQQPSFPDDRLGENIRKFYRDNGRIRAAVTYKDGQRFGKCMWWHRNGTRSEAGFYAGDMDLGRDEFDKSTRITQGIPDGKWSYWNEKGGLIASGRFKNGKPWLGSFYDYHGGNHHTGQRGRSVSFYERGMRHGEYLTWYEDWKAWVKGRYVEGSREGAWRYWDPSGKLIASGIFKGDRRWSGTFQHLDGSRNRWVIATYAKGKKTAVIDWQYGEKKGKKLPSDQQARKWLLKAKEAMKAALAENTSSVDQRSGCLVAKVYLDKVVEDYPDTREAAEAKRILKKVPAGLKSAELLRAIEEKNALRPGWRTKAAERAIKILEDAEAEAGKKEVKSK